MKLAIFDLDHTLMPLDTSAAWMTWLVARSGLRDGPFRAAIERFDRQYDRGELDIGEFMDFQLRFLARFRRAFLDRARDDFMADWLAPSVPPRAAALVDEHRRRGDLVALCSATYDYVSRPAAGLFGIDIVLSCRPEEDAAGEFTGRLAGRDSFGPSKVEWAREFLARPEARGLGPADLVFYSDSAVDLPLFEFTERSGGRCVAVNAGPDLLPVAARRGWERIAVYGPEDLARARQPRGGAALFPEVFEGV